MVDAYDSYMISDNIKKLKDRYRYGKDNIGKDLVGTCLAECTLYRRGTGFFSSSALKTYILAIDNILKDGTKIEILSSPKGLDRKTIDALRKSSNPEKRKKTLQEIIDRDILLAAAGYKLNQDSQSKYASQLLTYLIAKNFLEIRFAIPKNNIELGEINELDNEDIEAEEKNRNMYHVKNGYFKFQGNEFVAFDGSFNESDSGHQHNGERTLVFRSWIPGDHDRGMSIIEDIDEDWNSKNEFIEVFQLSDDAIKKIKEMSSDKRPKKENLNKPTVPEIPINSPEPTNNGLRPYQNQALKQWRDNSCSGILAMATGTGKTKTAIYAIKEFQKNNKNCLIIVTAPYIPLANQWIDELNKVNISTLPVFSENDWKSKVSNLVAGHNLNPSDGLSIPVFVCVNKTFQGEVFQNIIKRLTNTAVKRFIIVDECHHFNRTEALNLLPLSFEFRMGLSATPYEEGEPKLLDKYFDKVVFEYGVRQATDEGYLCPYYYHPILIELSKDEADKYIEVLEKISKSESSNNYLELDKILESVVAKLIKLQEILSVNPTKNYSLFYCGEGFIKFENDEKLRQIDAVTSLLDKLHWRIGKITSEESKLSREGTLENLRKQTINAIASMRILDEGIDVPDCQNAYILASQRSERQAIQRRGRILRKADSKNCAHLFDFIITGPKLSSNQLEKLYSREIKRAKLFSEDAINKSECLDILNKV